MDIPGAKFSHAIYSSYFTGQLPTNYKGTAIAGDHIIRAMKRNNKVSYKLRYIGPEWSFLSIWGKENYDTFFDKVEIKNEPLDVNYEHPYPFFFEDMEANSFFRHYLRDLKSNGASMFAHSGVFDHRQHGEHKGLGPASEEFPKTERMSKVLTGDLKKLKEWIDRNPDYLLILLSDHGVDEYGIAGYKMHGESTNGNEPFILLYNPSLSPKSEIPLDIVDVAPTLALYFEGIDIPANSMGITSTYFGILN